MPNLNRIKEEVFANSTVLNRNACEDRKLKKFVDHLDKLKDNHKRQLEKAKEYFEAQHLLVPSRPSTRRSIPENQVRTPTPHLTGNSLNEKKTSTDVNGRSPEKQSNIGLPLPSPYTLKNPFITRSMDVVATELKGRKSRLYSYPPVKSSAKPDKFLELSFDKLDDFLEQKKIASKSKHVHRQGIEDNFQFMQRMKIGEKVSQSKIRSSGIRPTLLPTQNILRSKVLPAKIQTLELTGNPMSLSSRKLSESTAKDSNRRYLQEDNKLISRDDESQLISCSIENESVIAESTPISVTFENKRKSNHTDSAEESCVKSSTSSSILHEIDISSNIIPVTSEKRSTARQAWNKAINVDRAVRSLTSTKRSKDLGPTQDLTLVKFLPKHKQAYFMKSIQRTKLLTERSDRECR